MNDINDYSKNITNDLFYKLTNDIRNNYRLSFTNIIIDLKHKTHICQLKCYETNFAIVICWGWSYDLHRMQKERLYR